MQSAYLQQRPSPSPTSRPKPTLRPTPKPTPSPKPVAWNSALASVYGGSDGFYYGHFACGGVYLPSIHGVAHKTLPCGTKVQFRYHGRSIIVRVVDRGPYCCGRSFDFTVGAAHDLRFPGVGRVDWRIVK